MKYTASVVLCFTLISLASAEEPVAEKFDFWKHKIDNLTQRTMKAILEKSGEPVRTQGSHSNQEIREKREQERAQYFRSLNDYQPPSVDSITIHSRTGISVEFVFIPPGEYQVGRDISGLEKFFRMTGQLGDALDEGQKQRVSFEQGFYLARCKVTAAQFALFLNAVEPEVTTRSVKLHSLSNLQLNAEGIYSAKPGAERFPANTVTWEGATKFCRWFTKESHWSIRLPTENEWEAATRTQKGFLTPTGGPAQPQLPLSKTLPGIRLGDSTVDVDAYPENMTENGLFHTLSWVADWTSDSYDSNRGKKQSKLDEFLIARSSGGHVMKGRGTTLTEREPGGEIRNFGIYGFRLLLEADQTGAPLWAKAEKDENRE
jgi:formylglycine-generating enzyme required for sulfatase activity